MPIDITGLNNTPSHGAGDSNQVQSGQKQPSDAQKETGRPSASDTVSLTDAATQLDKLEKSLSTAPVVDAQRVESIKQAVEQGRFEIDPESVAQKLMAFESALTKG